MFSSKNPQIAGKPVRLGVFPRSRGAFEVPRRADITPVPSRVLGDEDPPDPKPKTRE